MTVISYLSLTDHFRPTIERKKKWFELANPNELPTHLQRQFIFDLKLHSLQLFHLLNHIFFLRIITSSSNLEVRRYSHNSSRMKKLAKVIKFRFASFIHSELRAVFRQHFVNDNILDNCLILHINAH